MNTLFDKILDNIGTYRESVLATPPLPDALCTFLGRVLLLHGIPFPYLVPNEMLLEPESIKFFHLDPLWISSLFGGILSAGHPDDRRLLLNKAMAGNFAAELVEAARKARHNNLKMADAARAEADAEKHTQPPSGKPRQDPPAAPATPTTTGFTGFLLRSRLLAGWQGVEFLAYDAGKPPKELAFLRLERLAADVLFGLVDGKIAKLQLSQPPEGLHFDVKKYTATVGPDRRVNIKAIVAPGTGSASLAEKLKGEPLRTVITINR